jgi:hypothetical protein
VGLWAYWLVFIYSYHTPPIGERHIENDTLSRRDLLKHAALSVAALTMPARLSAWAKDPDLDRLTSWSGVLRAEGMTAPGGQPGKCAIRVGELATGTPYVPYTLDAYLKHGGSPLREPLTLSLSHFDCVTLVESSLAVARVALAHGRPSWSRFGQEIERMRYRGGKRRGYGSRLHYFSEWISDNAQRGLVQDLGSELGGAEDARPLRFMTEHRDKYPALADESVFRKSWIGSRAETCSPLQLKSPAWMSPTLPLLTETTPASFGYCTRPSPVVSWKSPGQPCQNTLPQSGAQPGYSSRERFRSDGRLFHPNLHDTIKYARAIAIRSSGIATAASRTLSRCTSRFRAS